MQSHQKLCVAWNKFCISKILYSSKPWQPLAPVLPANADAAVLHFRLCIKYDLSKGTSVSSEPIVIKRSRTVACKVSCAKWVEKCFCGSSAIYCFPDGYFDVRDKNKQHSLYKCARCFELHQNSQLSFPLKPTYHHNEPIITVNQEPIITVNQDTVKKLGIKKFATSVLTELNWVCENEASTSFTDALVSINSSGLEKKKGKRDKRREKVKLQKEFTKKVNDLFAEKAAISMLTECESKRKYHRKRMSQSFHSPQEQPPAKKIKTHSPDFSKVAWDKEKLKDTIENWPIGTTINWSNAGQVVKEFTAKQAHITTPKRKPTRPKRKKLPGSGEVSIPSNPGIGVIEAEIGSMVNGVMTPHELQIQGRKVPLIELRQRLLRKQLKYMRLIPQSTIATMTRPELTSRLNMNCDGKSWRNSVSFCVRLKIQISLHVA